MNFKKIIRLFLLFILLISFHAILDSTGTPNFFKLKASADSDQDKDKIYLHKFKNSFNSGFVIPFSLTEELAIGVNVSPKVYNKNADLHLNLYRASINDLLKYLVHDEKTKLLNPSIDLDKLEFVTSFDQQVDIYKETKVTLPLEGRGIWLINATYNSAARNSFIIRSEYGAIAKEGQNNIIFWAQNYQTKRSANTGKVTLYNLQEKITQTDFAYFKKDGTAQTNLKKNGEIAIVEIKGDYSLIPLNLNYLNYDYYYRNSSFLPQTKDIRYFIFTDRPLYRPGDIVHFKAIIRQDVDAQYSVPQGLAEVEVYQGGDENRTIYFNKKYSVSSDGTIDGEYALPEDLRTGSYEVSIKLDGDTENRFSWRGWGNVSSATYFSVEYYQKPEYEIKINAPRDIFLAGDKFEFKITGHYFSGQPISDKEIKYTVYSSNYHQYDFYRPDISDNDYSYRYWRGQNISSGQAKLKNGEAIITIDAIKTENNVDAIYSVEAEFKDETGIPVVDRKNFIVRAGEYGIYRKTYSERAKINEEISLPIILVSFANQEIQDTPFNVKIHRSEWTNKGREEEDLADFNITSNKESALIKFTPSKSGSYRIYVSGKDSRGNEIKNDFYLWISDKNTPYYYGEEKDEINLIVPKENYQPGEKLEFTINSTIPDRDVFLSVDRDWVKKYQVVHLNGKYGQISWPATAEYAPNIFISASSFSENSLQTALKEVNISTENKKVNIEIKADKEKYSPGESVTLEIKTTDNEGRPVKTEAAVWLVDKAIFELADSNTEDIFKTFWPERYYSTSMSYSLKGLGINAAEGGGCFTSGTQVLMKNGKTKNIEEIKKGDLILTRTNENDSSLVTAEVEKVHQAKVDGYLIINGHLRITPNHILLVNKEWQSAGNIQIGDILIDKNNHEVAVESIEWQKGEYLVYNLYIKDRHTFFADGIWVHNDKGGGGVRSVLKDTAYWNPKIHTGNNGVARIRFKLPDNLTTWVISAIATTKDAKVGQNLEEITVTKNIIIEPIIGEILRTGDQLTFSALLKNFTEKEHIFNVKLSFDSGTIFHPNQEISVKPKEVKQIFWELTADRPSSNAEFKIEAYAKDDKTMGDAIIIKKPVREFGFWQNESHYNTNNVNYPIIFEENIKKEMSVIELYLSNTLIGSLPAAMDYLIGYPYGCMEQTTSRFVPVVIAQENQSLFANALKDKETEKMMAEGLKRLRMHQKKDGGWDWWYSGASEPFITSYVVEYVTKAKKLGIEVNENILKEAEIYLKKLTPKDQEDYIYKTYALTFFDAKEKPEIIKDFNNLSAEALSLAVITNIKNGYHDPETNGLNKLITLGIKEKDTIKWKSLNENRLSSEETATALALRAIVAGQNNRDIADMALRYLMNARKADRWSNTYATARIIQALVDYYLYAKSTAGTNKFIVMIDDQEIYHGVLNELNQEEKISIPPQTIKKNGSILSIKQENNDRLYSVLNIKKFNTSREFIGTDNGISIKRSYKNIKGENYSLGVGDIIEIQLKIFGREKNRDDFRYLIVEDHLPAGMAPVNTHLKNEDGNDRYRYYGYSEKEYTEDGVRLVDRHPIYAQTLTYQARVINQGEFIVPPAQASLMYSPEINGLSPVEVVKIEQTSQKLYDVKPYEQVSPPNFTEKTEYKVPKTSLRTAEKELAKKTYWSNLISKVISISALIGLLMIIVFKAPFFFKKSFRLRKKNVKNKS